jgi:hypothetical protein
VSLLWLLDLILVGIYSVDNRNGQLALVVKVKCKINVPLSWTAQLRHNILAHGTFPEAPYFLMVFPDKHCCDRPCQSIF